MTVENRIRTLRAEIAKSLTVMTRIEDYILDFQKRKLSRTPEIDGAMIATQALINYYTCAETLFVRVSKFFEHELDRDKWHRSLLEKMALEIEDMRPKVISDSVYSGLLELLKFRHFSRYYFELDYDWNKLNYLLEKFNTIHDPLKSDLAAFDDFLCQLLAC